MYRYKNEILAIKIEVLGHIWNIYFLTDGLQTRFEQENEGSLVGEKKKDVKSKYRLLKRKKIVYFKEKSFP